MAIQFLTSLTLGMSVAVVDAAQTNNVNRGMAIGATVTILSYTATALFGDAGLYASVGLAAITVLADLGFSADVQQRRVEPIAYTPEELARIQAATARNRQRLEDLRQLLAVDFDMNRLPLVAQHVEEAEVEEIRQQRGTAPAA